MLWMNAARRRCLASLLVPFLAVLPTLFVGSAYAQSEVALAQTPFDGRASVPPLLLLALDLDETSLKTAWPDPYFPERVHEGYFHPQKCYRAGDTPDGYFDVDSDADASHACRSASYSGNFLNWATMTTVDSLRHVLTGGTRAIDTSTMTVLERVDVGTNPGVIASLRKSVTLAAPASAPETGEWAPARITPFDVPTIHTLACGRRLLLSSRPMAGDCSNPGAGQPLLADLVVRVRVCDGNRDRRAHCRGYANIAKPEGELQHAAPMLRIALLTNTVSRQAQSTARFIGPQGRSAPGWLAQANQLAEWDAVTGMAIAPARNARTVLQQVNGLAPPASRRQRGRAYAKALDYLARTGTGDPILAACQKNTVLHISGVGAIASGVNQDSTDSLGTSGTAAWMARIEAMEQDSAGDYGNPAPVTSPLWLEVDWTARQAAALAFRANIDGVRIGAPGAPTAPVRARTIGVDIGSEPDATRLLASMAPPPTPLLQPFLLPGKYGGFDDANQDGNPFRTSWPDPASQDSAGQLEWDRNRDGVPDRYHRAADAGQLLRAVRSAFLQIARSMIEDTIPAVAEVALLREQDLVLATHEPRTWTGSIRRYRLTRSDDGLVRRDDAPLWTSSIPPPAQRKIYTLGLGDAGRVGTVPLDWDTLPAAQKRLLDSSAQPDPGDGLGAQRVAWLRGERGQEQGNGGKLRRRISVMGDVMHGNLLWMAIGSTGSTGSTSTAPGNVPEEPGQDRPTPSAAAPASAATGPPGVLFAGANDGLLHAFDAATGVEMFAYLPAALVGAIPALTAPDYPHRAFVDGGLSLGSVTQGDLTRAILAGSFGRGARGVFALDVSAPQNFAAGAGALFEFTDADDAAMGHVLGTPRVVRIATASPSGRSARAFVLSEAGINSPAALFLIALDKTNGAWREGLNYFRISAASESEPASAHLGPVALVTASDGTLAHAWAGDLGGNLWRFSFTPEARLPAGFKVEVSLVFRAVDAQQLRQPITAAPRIAWTSGSGYLVLFGTGKMLEHADAAPASLRQDSLYAVHDRVTPGAAPFDRASLALRHAVQQDDGGWRVSGAPFSYDGPTRGWVLDLPLAGERVSSAAALAGGRMFVVTQIVPTDPCRAMDSRAWSLDVLSGLADSAIAAASTGGTLLRSPLVFQTDQTGLPDAFGRRASSQRYSVLFQQPGTPTAVAAGPAPPSHAGKGPAGRLSWREIIDWNPHKEQARAP